MAMGSGSLQLLFLILVSGLLFLETIKLGSSIEIEKKALLKFKDSLTDPSGRLSSWVGENYCTWSGVTCNNKTGNVIELNLSNPFPHSSNIHELRVAAIVRHRHRTVFCLPHLQGPTAIPSLPFPFSVASIVRHHHRTVFCLPHLQGPTAIPSLRFLSLPSVREQHNAGYKHKANARTYYQQFEAQQNQSLIHQKIKEHLGQTTAYQQVGAAYNALRSRVPILPTPMMPMAGNTQLPVNSPLIPGARPPVLPRPLPGYMSAPVMPPMVGPPAAAAALPGQITNLPRPPPMGAPSAVPGTTMTPASVSTSMVTPAMYQAANSAPPTSGGFDSFNMSAQAPEANQ